MDARVSWKQNLSFTGTAESGYELPLSAKADVGGDEDGFRPMELMAISLVGCTAMDVISILRKKRQDVTAFDVKVHVERADEHPKVFTSAVLEYEVVGRQVRETALVRAIELSAVRYCPAQAMLGKIMPITHEYVIYEDEGDGRRREVVRGRYEYCPDGVEV